MLEKQAMANRPKPEILEYKKIGRFDGYRTTAFFGFDLPRDPCKKRLHFHMPMTPSKYVAVRRSKSFENLFSSDDGSSVLAAGDNLKAVSVADQVPEIKGVEAIRALLYEKFGVLPVIHSKKIDRPSQALSSGTVACSTAEIEVIQMEARQEDHEQAPTDSMDERPEVNESISESEEEEAETTITIAVDEIILDAEVEENEIEDGSKGDEVEDGGMEAEIEDGMEDEEKFEAVEPSMEQTEASEVENNDDEESFDPFLSVIETEQSIESPAYDETVEPDSCNVLLIEAIDDLFEFSGESVTVDEDLIDTETSNFGIEIDASIELLDQGGEQPEEFKPTEQEEFFDVSDQQDETSENPREEQSVKRFSRELTYGDESDKENVEIQTAEDKSSASDKYEMIFDQEVFFIDN